MATVITNLVTAIPVIGQSIAELKAWGIVSNYVKSRRKKKDDYYNNLPYSFLSMLVGFIDGDGYIFIHKSAKGYIKINLIITLNIRDIYTLEYINNILKLGKINTYPKGKTPKTCKLVINKTDLQQILFPLLEYHNIQFLTKTRIDQYNEARHIIENNIKEYKNVDHSKIIKYVKVLNDPKYILSLKYFNNWLIGFTIANGSFGIKNDGTGFYQLEKRIQLNLFEAIQLLFNNKNNNKDMQLTITSKSEIQKVINFFSFEGNHPLVGYKHINYLNWLNNLKRSIRYSNLTYPIPP